MIVLVIAMFLLSLVGMILTAALCADVLKDRRYARPGRELRTANQAARHEFLRFGKQVVATAMLALGAWQVSVEMPSPEWLFHVRNTAFFVISLGLTINSLLDLKYRRDMRRRDIDEEMGRRLYGDLPIKP